jgi:hypothetical protein
MAAFTARISRFSFEARIEGSGEISNRWLTSLGINSISLEDLFGFELNNIIYLILSVGVGRIESLP